MAWYIDAWAPRDGIAFASERSAGDADAAQIVHIAAPDFVPTPVASPSTALWSTRGAFQECFFDELGEIAFDTLEQLIETVRRTFLGGGRGLPPPGTPGVPVPLPPLEPEGAAPDFQVPSPPTDGWPRARELLVGPRTLGDADALAEALREVIESSIESHLQPFGVDSVAAMFDELDRAAAPDLTSLRDVTMWVALLTRAALWPPPQTLADVFLKRHARSPEFQHLKEQLVSRYPWGWWAESFHHIDASDIGGLLFAVPIPRRWQGLRRARTLGDAICVASADRTSMSENIGFDEIVPLLAAAKVLAACAAYPGFAFFESEALSRAVRDEVVREAARWLALTLPGDELQGHSAERYIAKMVRLGEPPPDETPPNPTRGPPVPIPGSPGSGGVSASLPNPQSPPRRPLTL